MDIKVKKKKYVSKTEHKMSHMSFASRLIN